MYVVLSLSSEKLSNNHPVRTGCECSVTLTFGLVMGRVGACLVAGGGRRGFGNGRSAFK